MNGSDDRKSGSGLREIAVLKGTLRMPDLSHSGIFLIYAKRSDGTVQKTSSILADGGFLEGFGKGRSFREMENLIKTGGDTHGIATDLDGRLKENLKSHISPGEMNGYLWNMENNSVEVVESGIAKVIQNFTGVKKVLVSVSCEYVSYGDFEEYWVEDEINKLSFQSKTRIVQKYAGTATAAERIVRERVKDLAVIQFSFRLDPGMIGAGLILFSMETRSVYRVFAVTLTGEGDEAPSIRHSVAGFYKRLRERSVSQANASLSGDIEKKLAGASSGLAGALSREDKRGAIIDYLESLIMIIAAREAAVEVRLQFMESLKVDFLLEFQAEETGPDTAAREQPNMRIVNVKPVVSPIRGVKLSSLKRDDVAHVVIDRKDPVGLNVIRAMKLMEGDRVLPLQTTIYSIRFNPREGYTVYFRLAKGVLGKSVEEEDLLLKSGSRSGEDEISRSRLSLAIGIAAGLLVLLGGFFLVFFRK